MLSKNRRAKNRIANVIDFGKQRLAEWLDMSGGSKRLFYKQGFSLFKVLFFPIRRMHFVFVKPGFQLAVILIVPEQDALNFAIGLTMKK
ncbi:MAG: hypothetical protein M0R21_02170 [Lentimicrobiaceae bacterium]|jgi:hypothetical protein|nr:hypothetical protein [Lentimicrobiaceae bacterium]